MNKSGPSPTKGTSYFQLFKMSWLLQKKISERVYSLELIILSKKRLYPAIFDTLRDIFHMGNFINVFLYAIGSLGVSRIRDGNANP